MTILPSTAGVGLTETWFGGTGDWSTAANWTAAPGSPVTPVAGDTLNIASGTAVMFGAEAAGYGLFDTFDINLGTAGGTTPAVLQLANASLGPNTTITVTGTGSIEALGQSGIGAIIQDNGFLSVGATPSGEEPGTLTVLVGGGINFQGATLSVSGTLADDYAISGYQASGAPGTLLNNGSISVVGGKLNANTVLGTGTIDMVFGASVTIAGGANQTLIFDSATDLLALRDAAPAPGEITGFQPGDTLWLPNIAFTSAVYDGTADTLTLTDNGVSAAVINNFTATAGSLAVNNGSITYDSSPDVTKLEIAAVAHAVGADTVVSTMTMPHTGTPITGAGVKVGIISGSFNIGDAADGAAFDGYIPNANGVSTVQILSDAPDGTDSSDDGLAMAEDIYAVAPGASIAFASVAADNQGGDVGFANAVQALQNAGCDIIVDDIGLSDTPIFQTIGTVASAMNAAIASGINYFAASGDSANNFLDAPFIPQTVTLANGVVAPAEIFDNGTPYEPVGNADGSSWLLEWNTPFGTPGFGTAPALQMALFDAAGTLISDGTQNFFNNDGTPGDEIQQESIVVPSGGPYYIAVYGTGNGTPTQFELFNPAGATGQTGELLDPEAGASGSQLMGQDLVPGVNNVGATDYGGTPAFSQTGDFPEYFSVGGAGTLYYDSNNNPLSPPAAGASVDFVAPDGGGSALVFGLNPFFGTSAAAPVAAGVAALMLQANPNLTTAQVTAMLEQSAVSLTNTSAFEQGAGLIQAPGAVALALAAECYAAGTRLLTDRGEVAVEALRIGDRLVLADGGTEPVRWTGWRRIDCRDQPTPEKVWPVRITAHAFGPGRPHRDLIVSPDHALYLDGVLIPARCLIDGRRIVQEPAEVVTWWHVELPFHAAILAEGLAAESYLDSGNRAAFTSAAGGTHRASGIGAGLWDMAACAPLVLTGPRLAQARLAMGDRG